MTFLNQEAKASRLAPKQRIVRLNAGFSQEEMLLRALDYYMQHVLTRKIPFVH